MPRGRILDAGERAQLRLMKTQNWSHGKMAAHLNGRSVTVVRIFFKLGKDYGKRSYAIPRRKIDKLGIRRIKRDAVINELSAKQIIKENQLDISVRHCQRIIKDDAGCRWRSKTNDIDLTRKHREKRKRVSEEYSADPRKISRLICSDYKKFTLDGPYKRQKCWQDPRRPRPKYLMRQMGGGSLMVWGAFSKKGKTRLCFTDTKIDSAGHCKTLGNYLLPFCHEHYLLEDGRIDAEFQQDGAKIYTSRYTREWLEEQRLEVMDWPARSPDLNPIENLWAILSQLVYAGNRQYRTKSALKVAIEKAWDEIDQATLNKLIDSMHNRFDMCISLKGGKTSY